MATFYQDAVKQIGSTEAILHSLYKKLGRKDHVEFTEELLEKSGGTKKEMASFLFKVVNCSLDCIKLLKTGCLEVDALKSEAKYAMKELADVQSELLTSKREQIVSLQSGIQKTLKTELKSYSEAVKKSSGECMTLKNIRTVVKDVVEDRSRNIMIFGLEETAGENLHANVKEVFGTIQEKPLFKAERIGKNRGEDFDRPVKVVLDNSTAVSEILSKSKDLKGSVFDGVFLKPDRTLEQRRKHRELVAEMKRSAKDSPDKHFFIKNGEVYHQDKAKQDLANAPANSATISSGSGVTEKKKKPRKLLPHHIAANRRPPLGYVSPSTTDYSDSEG